MGCGDVRSLDHILRGFASKPLDTHLKRRAASQDKKANWVAGALGHTVRLTDRITFIDGLQFSRPSILSCEVARDISRASKTK
jgi:hypothetical protein